MKAFVTILAVAGMFSSGAAIADGNQLLVACQAVIKVVDGDEKVDRYDVGYCVGIVEATEGAWIIFRDSLPDKLKVCYPEAGINNGQKARIVVKYLNENPALLDKPATLLALAAYKSAYPCK